MFVVDPSEMENGGGCTIYVHISYIYVLHLRKFSVVGVLCKCVCVERGGYIENMPQHTCTFVAIVSQVPSESSVVCVPPQVLQAWLVCANIPSVTISAALYMRNS